MFLIGWLRYISSKDFWKPLRDSTYEHYTTSLEKFNCGVIEFKYKLFNAFVEFCKSIGGLGSLFLLVLGGVFLIPRIAPVLYYFYAHGEAQVALIFVSVLSYMFRVIAFFEWTAMLVYLSATNFDGVVLILWVAYVFLYSDALIYPFTYVRTHKKINPLDIISPDLGDYDGTFVRMLEGFKDRSVSISATKYYRDVKTLQVSGDLGMIFAHKDYVMFDLIEFHDDGILINADKTYGVYEKNGRYESVDINKLEDAKRYGYHVTPNDIGISKDELTKLINDILHPANYYKTVNRGAYTYNENFIRIGKYGVHDLKVYVVGSLLHRQLYFNFILASLEGSNWKHCGVIDLFVEYSL